MAWSGRRWSSASWAETANRQEQDLKFRRALLITELEGDVGKPLAALRRVAPALERLIVVGRLPSRSFAWFSPEAPADLNQSAHQALARLREAADDVAPQVQVQLAASLDQAPLDVMAAAERIDLLATGSLPLGHLPVLAELRKRRALALLWLPPQADTGGPPVTRLACVCMGRRASAAVATFLRDHAEPTQQVTVLTLSASLLPDLAEVMDIAGIQPHIEVLAPQGRPAWSWLERHIRSRGIEMLVFTRLPTALLLNGIATVPALLLPPAPSIRLQHAPQRGLDAPDLVDDGGALRARFEHAVGIGRRSPIPDQEIALVAQGMIVARFVTRDGNAELPQQCRGPVYGAFRTALQAEAFPVAAVEQRIQIVGPRAKPLIVFDADLPDHELAMLAHGPAAATHDHLAVRIRPVQPCRAIRQRLREAGLAPRVVDCRVVLDEGEALDVSEIMDAVRLVRVAARLRACAFPVAAVVYGGAYPPAAAGLAVLRADELAGHAWAPVPRPAPPRSVGVRLACCAAAQPSTGNRVIVELDNVVARRWLLEAIDAARERVHLQVYMMADDDIGRLVEGALARAGARGVTVRVLVDSLHGMHGSLGNSNPILARLGACKGVEVRVSAPIAGIPSLQDLKQRDHRKLVVVDNRIALIGGRNVSHEYYTGFDEVALTQDSTWRQVPWLDAGARVEGSLAVLVERAFLEAWQAAGGSGFGIVDCSPTGDVAARLVLHRGLRDANTLEAYLALIETAASHIDVVNGFPLILEIQHALLRALQRGVRVRTLFGHLAPTHADVPFEGPWSSARAAATTFVHARMDALVQAGGEAYQFAMPEQPSWASGLGPVNSHVHAKLMSVDGRICAVGSANMDITAGYWESELLLVLEDPGIAAATEARIEQLLAGSQRVRRDDPAWQALARRREWLRYWPGVLSV